MGSRQAVRKLSFGEILKNFKSGKYVFLLLVSLNFEWVLWVVDLWKNFLSLMNQCKCTFWQPWNFTMNSLFLHVNSSLNDDLNV